MSFMLVVGTPDGIYRVPPHPFEHAEQVLHDRSVRQLRIGQGAVFAATGSGMLRSMDGGDTWTTLDLPADDVHAVHCTEEAVYAGVQPTDLYRSNDSGESWELQTSFSEFATDASWPTNPYHNEACVRTVATPTPEVVLVGVEVGGFVASTDGGRSWRQYDAVPDEVHHVLARSPERWVVSCGVGGPDRRGGVFETVDGGDTWTEHQLGPYVYVRESCHHDRLYTAGNQGPPPWEPAEATLFVERDDELDRMSYPGEPEAYVIPWASMRQAMFAGANDGSILRGRGDEWERLGTVPVSADDRRAWGVRSMAIVES